jgi:hypothetical protein
VLSWGVCESVAERGAAVQDGPAGPGAGEESGLVEDGQVGAGAAEAHGELLGELAGGGGGVEGAQEPGAGRADEAVDAVGRGRRRFPQPRRAAGGIVERVGTGWVEGQPLAGEAVRDQGQPGSPDAV